MSRILFIVLLLIFSSVSNVWAQDQDSTATTVEIILEDGSEYIGIVVAEDDSTLSVRTRGGVMMMIPRAQVTRIVPVQEALIGGSFVRLDPNRTRLFFAPTARSLGNNRGYFADYYLFFPMVAYGIGNMINLSGGLSLLPFSRQQLLYFAPKVTVYQNRSGSIAAGALLSTTIGGDAHSDDFNFGLFYGVGTFGLPHSSVTIGLAFGMVQGKLSDKPTLMLGYEHQVSGSIKLISENYLFLQDDDAFLLVSGGIRFFGKRLAADLAAVTMPELIDEGGFPFIPFLGFAYNFGM